MTELVGSGPLSTRFDTALVLAADLHRHQVRKGSRVPYLSHVLAVASSVIEQGGDEDEAIAGLLHDAVEDQGGQPTLARIRATFGDRVADIVAACSDTDVIPKPPWRLRKEAYIEHLRQPDLDPGALRVSLADKVHNASAILADLEEVGDALWGRFNAGPDDQLWYYESLRSIFEERLPGRTATIFSEIVDQLRQRIEAVSR